MFYLDLFRMLEEAGVRYLVVGGIAFNPHSVSRLTHDVDLVFGHDADAKRIRHWADRKRVPGAGLRRKNAVVPTVHIHVKSPGEFEAAFARRVVADVSGQKTAMIKADSAEMNDADVNDYYYELSDQQLLHGLSMTPLQRLTWLDEARRFVLALRSAPRTYYENGKAVRTVVPG